MENRFEVIKEEIVEYQNADGYNSTKEILVFRDKQTGVLYMSDYFGLTPLIDKDGKPVILFKVNI